MKTEPCIHVLVAYCGEEENKMLVLIIITIVLIAYYEPNNYLIDK